MTADVDRTTRLLQRASAGDGAAGDELLPLVYDELRGLASRFLARGRAGSTLQPTALVHEAYLRLIDRDEAAVFNNRIHFFRVAARAMRGVLVNHVKAKGRLKRGGDQQRVTLADSDGASGGENVDLLALDEALTRLAIEDEPLAQIVELRFFSGMTIEETAALLDVSAPTVERRWRVARAFLRREIRAERE